MERKFLHFFFAVLGDICEGAEEAACEFAAVVCTVSGACCEEGTNVAPCALFGIIEFCAANETGTTIWFPANCVRTVPVGVGPVGVPPADAAAAVGTCSRNVVGVGAVVCSVCGLTFNI